MKKRIVISDEFRQIILGTIFIAIILLIIGAVIYGNGVYFYENKFDYTNTRMVLVSSMLFMAECVVISILFLIIRYLKDNIWLEDEELKDE